MTTNYCKTLTILCASLFLILPSCKPDKKDLCSINVTNIYGTYRLVAMKYKMSTSAPEQDYMVYLDNCEKDDLIVLNADGTYNYKDVGMVCSTNNNNTGTWGLSNNSIISDGVVGGTVVQFDCKTMVCQQKDLNTPGDQLTVTFSKQ